MASSGVLPKRPGETPVPGMSVRALERVDLPAVAALVRETFRLGPRRTEPALADFLARTLIEQPWADPEIPSLVAFDESGDVVGFVAAEVRRMRLEGRTLGFAWAGHSAVAPAARGGALHPDYDDAFLDWLFGELRRLKHRGEPVAQLVRDARGRPLGWYVYFLPPGWRSEVLQIAATGERALRTVLDHLLAHAYAGGSAALGDPWIDTYVDGSA